MKQIIKLNEQDLHRIIKESVRRVLNENELLDGGAGPNDAVENEIDHIVDLVMDLFENETGEEYNGEELWPIREVLDRLGYKPCGDDYWCKGDIKIEVYFDKGDAMWHIDPA